MRFLLGLLAIFTFAQAEFSEQYLTKLLQVPKQTARRMVKNIKNARFMTETLAAFSSYYYVLPRFINERNYRVGCEIGVFLGGHVEHIMQSTAVETIYAIDPYTPYYDRFVVRSFARGVARRYWPACFDAVFYYVNDRLSLFGERAQLLRMTSHDAAALIPDESMDFVFIDGDHRYAAVLQDVSDYYNKVRSGGMISGDDYNFPEVSKAVDEYFGQLNLTVHLDVEQPRFWWVDKP